MARQPATTASDAKPPAKRRARRPAAPKAEAAEPAAIVEESPAPEPTPRPKRRFISLPNVEEASSRLRTVLLNFAFVGAFIVLVPVIVSQFWRSEVLIDTIPVPAAMAEIGLTPEVVANRLWDGIRDATRRANTSKTSVTALPDSQRVEFSLPESGFSMESLIQQTRAFFHAYQTRISGEITCGDPACDPKKMKLRLRVLRETSKVIDMPAVGNTPLRDYFTAAAVQVLTILDPFVAVASISGTEPIRAEVLARNLIRQRHPDAKWAHLLIGIMKATDGEADTSIAEFRAALELDPEFFQARRNLAARLVQSGKLDEATAEYEVLAKKWANDVEVIAGQGELAFARKEYAEAKALYAKAERIDPRKPLYVSRQGDAALGLADAEGGVALLQRALQMDPAFIPAMASLASHYFDSGDVVTTVPFFADFAEIAPDDADAQAMYGQVLRFNNKPEEGLSFLLKAQVLQPKRSDIAAAVASAYIDVGDLEKAEAAVTAGLEADDKVALLHAQLAVIRKYQSRFQDSIASWETASKLDPTNAAYVAGSAEILMVMQRYPEALARFDEAIKVEPDRPDTWSFKGAVLKYMGRKDEAIAALMKFLALSEGRPEYAGFRKIAQDDLKSLGAAP